MGRIFHGGRLILHFRQKRCEKVGRISRIQAPKGFVHLEFMVKHEIVHSLSREAYSSALAR